MEQQDNNTIQSVAMSKDELLLAIQFDCVVFFSFYLGDELSLEVPDFHETIWAELLEQVKACNFDDAVLSLQKLFAVPRGHAKSTVAKLAVILFLKYTAFKFCLYVSKTNGIAKNAIRDILMWLSSSQERELFGPMVVVKSSETDSLWIVDIATRSSASSPIIMKRCIFKALGTDQQVRGTLILNTRPQIVIVDDIEDLDNTSNPAQQSALDSWFAGSLMKSFGRRYIVIFIGNMIRSTTLLARFSKDPEWNPTVFGAIVRDSATNELRALWEGRHTVESLLKQYQSDKKIGQGASWEAEMMNLTQDEVLAEDFKDLILVPLPEATDLEAGILILDPAFGDNAWNDPSAITVHARIKGRGIPVIIDSWVGRVREEALFDAMLDLSYRWGISTWAIESEAAQKLLIPYFNLLIQNRKLNQSLFLLMPIGTGKKAKAARIMAFRRALSTSSYGVCETQMDLVYAVRDYNSASKKPDDLPDSAAYGLLVWQSFNHTITSRGIQQVALLAHAHDLSYSSMQQGIEVATF